MKKPFKISSREFGRGKPSVEAFATLAEATQYIRDRWQGAEYVDGDAAFHTDYCSYTLAGFALADIGHFTYDEFGRDFVFGPKVAPKPVCARRCADDSCDGAHCRVCGGHFLDFCHGGPICTACQIQAEHLEQTTDPRCDREPGCDANGFDLRAPFPHASDPHWSSPEADFSRW